MTTVVRSNFIGIFKIGDNIQHNLQILRLLYRYFNAGNEAEKKLLCKPIIITIVSIVEAVFYDFIFRARIFTIEGIAGIGASILAYIRSKKIDKFETYIASMKKHAILGPSSESIYDDLDTLRKLRNRVHIQNDNGDFEADEIVAFNIDRKILAEKALEKVMKTMAFNHARPRHVFGDDFELPWNEHYP